MYIYIFLLFLKSYLIIKSRILLMIHSNVHHVQVASIIIKRELKMIFIEWFFS